MALKTVLGSAATLFAVTTGVIPMAHADTAQKPAAGARQSAPPLMRYPTVHGDTVVFEAGGNLWKTTTHGGMATQLTDDPGFDEDAHFSPNGKWVAFTGWYQGNTDVYIVPAAGGRVRRLTYHSINNPSDGGKLKPSTDNRVLGWTPDSNNVVFLSRRDSFNPQVMHAYTVPVGGGLPKKLPIPWTGPLSFGPNDHTVAYNKLARVYRPFHRKHYYGGQAQDIWTFDYKNGKSHRITHWKGADVWPMWSGDTIYFSSDRGPNHIQNLWAYSQKTKQFTQLTHFSTYDIDFPTLGGNKITFSDGGDLYVYNTKNQDLTKLNVRVPLNGVKAMPHWAKVEGHVDGSAIAPNGHLAVFSARGALFTVPAKYGSANTLTQNPAADQRDPAWSPNGKQIAYIGAEGDHQAVYVRPADGGKPKALTHDKLSVHGPLSWSRDSKHLTYVDADQTLWMIDVKSGKRTRITRDPSKTRGNFSDLHWSPGSDWLAFSKAIPQPIGNMTVPNIQAIYLYHVTDGKLTRLGDGQYNDSDPFFSDDGKYLFFVSQRIVNPTFSNFDEITAGLKSSGLYAATLKKDTPSPIAPRVRSATKGLGDDSASSDDDSHKKNAKAHDSSSNNGKESDKKSEHKTGRKPIDIDVTGLMGRAVRLPVPDADISSVAEAKGVVYYTTQPSQTIEGPLSGEQSALRAYDMDKRKDHTLETDVKHVALSADGSTLFYQHKGNWTTRPASFVKNPGDDAVDKIDLSGLKRWVQPEAEWPTAYGEAMRDVRDYFLDPKLIHKIWPAIDARYRKLLDRAATRRDVDWLIANAMGTTGESHMYVRGGNDGWKTPANPTADLGAEFALDPDSGRYKIAKIYKGDNTVPGYRAPLNQPGLKVKAGDYLLAINGQPLKAPTNPYKLLQGTNGDTISLKVADDADGKNAYVIHVEPVANAHKLHLLAWIRHNRQTVDKMSDGQIGYVYLEDMEATGMKEFIRQYYSQRNKKAIIFDDRWNLGGFIDPMLFDRIDRQLDGMFTNRYRATSPTPNAPMGYMAALINRGSASDGDIFAYMFKKDHLGPTIGSRTWAGVRGYDGSFDLLGGGSLVVSDNGMYGTHGQWIVENIGVEPDVRVHDKPEDLNAGHDAQLEKAVHMLMAKIKAHPKTYPQAPSWMPAFPPQPDYPSCGSDKVGNGVCDWHNGNSGS
ncbi:S41 family peptidase [Salinisphaera sp. LB1]|uniref:S41 family peptidase n=1 Tax=Salinisphaera sp. LB1 TaxID=2183911 RepID=UPI000D708A39|nr:S41 family peptidase [Salinisphaera sp. LB1]